jgi:hypothetical protein
MENTCKNNYYLCSAQPFALRAQGCALQNELPAKGSLIAMKEMTHFSEYSPTTSAPLPMAALCQRSFKYKLKAIHNTAAAHYMLRNAVSKIV